MLIKSGEGVVILTRPQKYFQSSLPSTKNKSFIPTPRRTHLHPEHMCPGPLKQTPIPPIWPVPQEKSEKKLRINLTFMPKIGIITL